MKTLYVSNIPFSMESGDLYPIFEAFGDVLDVRVVTDRETARSRGYAFVDMAETGEAKGAIEGLNGKKCQGRVIRVAEAMPRRSEMNRRNSPAHQRKRHPYVRWINRTRRLG